MNSNWIVDLPNGAQDIVQCLTCGVAQDGSLICFMGGPSGQGEAIKGYAPGQWLKFTRSSLRSS